MIRAVDIIRKKREGGVLTPAEIESFVQGVTSRSWPDYQASALLMAIVLKGMTPDETACLTAAMVHSGVKLTWNELPGQKVDKHSTGGVGDKTSLILAPLVAACGAVVPMMSGRGLGHTGGTLDKLEAIPGFRVNLNLSEMRQVLAQVGCVLIGQTQEVAPADKILYALRDVTATVESIPLISASIMSKKIAEGIDALVLDVKFGSGAFMRELSDARKLAQSLVQIGIANGVRTQALLTRMESPLGRAVGNALEIRECIEILQGKETGVLTELSLELASRMLFLSRGVSTLDEARQRIEQAWRSGTGLQKFKQIVQAQGGDPRCVEDVRLLPTAAHRHLLRADRAGFVSRQTADKLGVAAMLLGAGRERVEDKIDPGVGLYLHAQLGSAVQVGDPLVEVHYNDAARLPECIALCGEAIEIAKTAPVVGPLVVETIGG